MRYPLKIQPWQLSIVKLSRHAMPPVGDNAFFATVIAPNECSLVCETAHAPASDQRRDGWRCLEVTGPLDFAMVGVLAEISRCLAERGISIVAISSFDTDYILVPQESLLAATEALRSAGHRVA